MLGLIFGLGIPFYLLVGLVTYRRLYIKRQIEYRRWQNEAPERSVTWDTDYGIDRRLRKNVGYSTWVWKIFTKEPPGVVSSLWIFYAVAWPIYRFTHPEIKVPDVTKITELEEIQG